MLTSMFLLYGQGEVPGESTLPWDIIASGVLLIVMLYAFFLLRKKMLAPLPEDSRKTETVKPEITGKTPELQTTTETKLASPVPSSSPEWQEAQEIAQDNRDSWLQRLKKGMSKTRHHMKDNLMRLLGSRAMDDKLLEEVHEVLYRSDLGVETADYLVSVLKKRYAGQMNGLQWPEVAETLRTAVAESLSSGNQTLLQQPETGPLVILIVGVNGVGKTTSLGKLSARFLSEGKSVMLCAGDTFRAAAIDQLQVWADRLKVPLIKQQQSSDPASVAFDAVKAAKARGVDILLIDTAGRLHNKSELMDELSKIKRVIGKELPGAPHETWLVIDATTGQNAVQQVKAFGEIVPLTGLVVTKLDGTAKGGVIIGINHKFKIPIRYIGVGEKAADLKEFSAQDFAESLFDDEKEL